MSDPMTQLEAMRTVSENWDGYGAAAPQPVVIDLAVEFVRRVTAACDTPITSVSPSRIGGVLIEWEAGPRQLEVEFRPGWSVSFVYVDLDRDEEVTGVLR